MRIALSISRSNTSAGNDPWVAEPEINCEEVSQSPLGLALTSLTDQSKMQVWACRKLSALGHLYALQPRPHDGSIAP